MKKVFLAAVTLISVAFVGNANAQTTDSKNVTVNIKLQPIHTLVVTTGQENINLTYANKNDYNDGVTSTQNNHLTIFSTGGFVVNVKALTKFTNSALGSTPIDENTVTVTASNGSDNTLSATTPSIQLGLSDQLFIQSATGGRDKKFNVAYKGAGGDTYINKYDKDFNGAAENIYTATVTYTLMAD